MNGGLFSFSFSADGALVLRNTVFDKNAFKVVSAFSGLFQGQVLLIRTKVLDNVKGAVIISDGMPRNFSPKPDTLRVDLEN